MQPHRRLTALFAGLLVATALVATTTTPVSGMPASSSGAVEATSEADEALTSGPVTGRVRAATVRAIGLCSQHCFPSKGRWWETVGNPLPPAAAVNLEVKGRNLSAPAVDPERSYAVYYVGKPYPYHRGLTGGFLRRLGGNKYEVIASFEDATKFTAQEGQALRLGMLNTQYHFGPKVKVTEPRGASLFFNFYGDPRRPLTLTVQQRAHRVPKKGRVIVVIRSCGQVKRRAVFRKSGTYPIRVVEDVNRKKYGKRITVRTTIVRGKTRHTFYEGRFRPTYANLRNCS